MKVFEAFSGECAKDFNRYRRISLQHIDQLVVAEHVLAIEQGRSAPLSYRLNIIRPVIEEEDLIRLDLDLIALLDPSNDPGEHLIL